MLLELYTQGTLGAVSGNQASPEPNLTAPDLLYVDGVALDYDLAQWDFRPNKDIHVEDTGFGVVRIAWPELESSGTLSFTLDFVPQADLETVLGVLLDVRPQRWLSYRGRRYRVQGFTPSYSPIPSNPDYYRIEVSCVAYRPHRSLPPVPGTEIYPIADVRRYGGLSTQDRILWLGGFAGWLVVVTTSGLTAWDPASGKRFTHFTPVDSAGLLSHADGMAYVVWGYAGRTYFKALNLQGFQPEYLVLDVPFSPYTHRLNSDTLTFVEGGVLKRVSYYQASTKPVPGAPSGLRVNPLGSPAFLSTSPTSDYPDTLANVPPDALGAFCSGKQRVLVFRPGGVYLHALTENVVGSELRQLETCTQLTRFGVFGAPGFPEGYWLKEADRVVQEPYVRVGDPYAVGLSDTNGDGWLEAPITYRQARIRSVYSDVVVRWGALQGIYHDGQSYYPYTDQHVFSIFPLL
jgi:hypothetical protein